MRRPIRSLMTLLAVTLTGGAVAAERATVTSAADPHYTAAGFFDVHVCNWPERPLFLLTLFSTTRFDEVAAIEVIGPDGTPLGRIATERYRLVREQGKPEKRVFMHRLDLPAGRADGWYQARVTLTDGSVVQARDYVVPEAMARAAAPLPADGAEAIPIPAELSWQAAPGARYYQVFVRDLWDGERVIYTSELLTEPRLALPPDLLAPGGLYRWRVHARDVNGNVLLGDFNHGSLSKPFTFATAD